ncbi:MAG TPA: alpha/beta fold hydrolase, partial [Flavisolibacter sp.]|nr:alpha/beta fold hydrolase [Flavisolibacter sp.]
MQTYHHFQPLQLECGSVLNQLHVGYHTHGKLNNERDNVIWICHALTGDTNVAGWWPGLIGKEAPFDTDKYFIVCANMLGSCYGTTGPLSIDTATGQPYHHSFPPVTIRDMVAVHALLATHLGIKKIHLLAGGSMGGYLAIEWCVMHPRFINRLFLIATSAQESAWGIAIHTAQRMAIEADVTWNNNTGDAGKQGLKAARAIGMITYRSYK